VGRPRGGLPGRLRGYCPFCGTAFDHTGTADGPVVSERYQRGRSLGAGGGGEAFLAWDRNLDTFVVLKHLRQGVAATAQAEKDVLVGLRHDSIVRILGYEPAGPYLVLEYVPGTVLGAAASGASRVSGQGQGAGAATDVPDPLVVLTHGLQVLQALDYLHGRGLLHCDVKPANIVRFREESPAGARDRVRLIDFGAVRRIGSRGPIESYTVGYAPDSVVGERPRGGRPHPRRNRSPEAEAPGPGFDLHCLGRTLAELCGFTRASLREPLPGDPVRDALRRLLLRATRPDPADRFRTARQFAEQLSGVIRMMAARGPAPYKVTRPSALFGTLSAPFDAGLGGARPVEDWRAALGSWRTAPAELRASPLAFPELPSPLHVPDPRTVAAALAQRVQEPDEEVPWDQVRRAEECREALAALTSSAPAGRPDLPEQTGMLVEQLVEEAGRAPGETDARAGDLPAHWAVSWHQALLTLAAGQPEAARVHAERTLGAAPGELLPRLLLGLIAEQAGRYEEAADHCATVLATAPALGAAGFGLARARLATGRRDAAAEGLETLTGEARFAAAARIARVRVLCAVVPADAGPAAGGGGGPDEAVDLPDEAQLERAEAEVARAAQDPGTREALAAEIAYARLCRAATAARRASGGRDEAGDRRAVAALDDARAKASGAVRALAARARSEAEHTDLMDLAYGLRPPVEWWWQRLPRRAGGAAARARGTR